MLNSSAGAVRHFACTLGKPDFVFCGAHVPLVPTRFRLASKLRVRMTDPERGRRDFALINFAGDVERIIVDIRWQEGNLAFYRVNGEYAGCVPLLTRG